MSGEVTVVGSLSSTRQNPVALEKRESCKEFGTGDLSES